MSITSPKAPSRIKVIIAFAIVYVVWGSTYFFIQKAVAYIPPMLLGAIRFLASGSLLMGWCLIKGTGIGSWPQIKSAIITGLLLLLVGNGAVMWAEKSLPSSLVAVLVSSAPLWFVLLDKPKWKENLTNAKIVLGLIIGFIGVLLLFWDKVLESFSSSGTGKEIMALVILMIGSISWAGGSLYSKYKATGSVMLGSAWQMLAAGIAFSIISFSTNDYSAFEWRSVTAGAWFAAFYLVIMGSLAAYSAYVWLLETMPAAQVSTYAYVNPLIAVLLGVVFANEHLTFLQVTGLVVILVSVLLINLSKYRKK